MPISSRTRQEVKARDRFCRGCGQSASHIHHIVFRSQGGSDEAENLVWLCMGCHILAHGMGPRLEGWELGLTLRANVSTVLALRATGADRVCGGCDRYGALEGRCLLWDQQVDWNYVCGEYKRRE